jgi:hemolysin III
MSRYSPGEEIANGVTHGLGVLLGIAGLAVLAAFSSLRGGALHVTACSIYGATLILAYAASTLYHSISSPRAKAFLQAMDHASIYLLIAGTYTPLTLVTLRGPWGWSLFGFVWGLTFLGITLELMLGHRFHTIGVVFYVVMGWSAAIAVKPLLASLPRGGLELLLAGGLAYTGGITFYLMRRLPYHHAIWHLFVLAGSVLHFFCILFYVLPPSR